MKKVRMITAVLMALVCMLSMSSCLKYQPLSSLKANNETLPPVDIPSAGGGTPFWENAVTEALPGAPLEEQPDSPTDGVITPDVAEPSSAVTPTEPSAPEAPPASADVSTFSKDKVLSLYQTALNQTRAYQGNVSVTVTESFDAEVKEATPNVGLVKTLANYIVDLVGSEGEQTLNFSAGKGTNADGETVPILLPQRTAYSLPSEGVVSASATEENGYLHVKIVLVPETVAMGEVPKYNSTSIGYLDTSSMEFSIITIHRVDISYPGSVIDAYIRPDGYIQRVTYTINMSTYAELSGMGITGSGTLEGAQTERWDFSW